MKHKMILLFAMVAATAFAFATPTNVAACVFTYSNPYSGAWQPTDDSVFLVELSSAASSASLHIYDFGAPENDLPVLSDGIFANTNIFFSSAENTDGSIAWYADTVPNGHALAFVSAPVFGFYFSQGSSNWQEYDLSGTSAAFRLYEMNTGMDVLVHDSQPAVPVPAAIFLLGSGLIGLSALRRR